jgi:hypothetical protein
MKKMKTVTLLVLTILSLSINAQSYDIGEEFIASGYMGDIDNIEMFSSHRENPHSAPICFMVRYKPGSSGWAGVYWQNTLNNWGENLGFNFAERNYNKVVFWAKGETGTEIIEFKAGGINKKQFKDSYTATTIPRRIPLTVNWQRYEIDLTGKDLSSIIGGFAWVASANDNPNGVTFYLDDINFINE